MGCHRRLCLARLLNRSGYGFVTVFERLSLVCIVPFVPSVSKHVQFPLRYTFTVVKSIHSLHSVPTFQSFHTLETIPLRKSKTPPNPCAYCIGHFHSLPAVLLSHLRSTRSRLACSSRSSFHKLHSFRKPPAVRRAALLHAAALKAVLPCLMITKSKIINTFVICLKQINQMIIL